MKTDRNISVLRRFIVKSILASEYEVSLGHSEPEKVPLSLRANLFL